MATDYFWMDFNPTSNPHTVDGGFFEGSESWNSANGAWEIEGGTAFDDTDAMACGWASPPYDGIYTAVRTDQDLSDNTSAQGSWCSCAREQGGAWPWQHEDSRGWGLVEKSFNLADYVDVTQTGFSFTGATFYCDYKINSTDFDCVDSHVYFNIYLCNGSTSWPLRYNYHSNASDAPSETMTGWCTDFWDPEYTGDDPNEFVNDYSATSYVTGVSGDNQYTSPIEDLFNNVGTSWTIRFKINVRCYGGGLGNKEEYQFWIDNVRIKCNYEYNSPPIASTPSGPTNLIVGETGTFSVTGTDPDNDYIQLQVDFDAEGSHDYSDWSDFVPSGSTCTIDHYWNAAGTYVVKAHACDEYNFTGDWSSGLTVVVSPPNQKPTVAITYPTEGQTVSGTIAIAGTASDDGDVVLVEIKIDDGDWEAASGTTSWSKSWDTTGVENGEHIISARSKDNYDVYSDDFYVTVYVGNNNQPVKPATPTGETNGKINVEYTYTTSTTDLDGDQVYYWFDWGDDTNSGWVGPYDSGTTASAEHAWTAKETYEIKVKAKDTNGAESDWSDPLPVTMPKNIISKNPSFMKFFEYFQKIKLWLRQILSQ
jgi:hypothetical protein